MPQLIAARALQGIAGGGISYSALHTLSAFQGGID